MLVYDKTAESNICFSDKSRHASEDSSAKLSVQNGIVFFLANERACMKAMSGKSHVHPIAIQFGA